MVNAAPNFGAIAGTVFSFLKDCIFVAHNVNFDYSFVRKELENHGYILNTNKLCSLRMSRRIFPGYKHYSLGNICSQLGIDVSDRHRAMGDAYATVELFLRLLKNDTQNEIPKSLKKNSFDQTLPPNLPKEQFENLPKEAGVYYFRDEHQKVIYVGKAINIRKRVNSHFTGNVQTPQRQHFLREIRNVLVFFFQQAASGVHQTTARLQKPSGALQNRRLLGRQLGNQLWVLPPLEIRITP